MRPFATEAKNVVSVDQQCRKLALPDVVPAVASPGRLTLTSGNWLRAYGTPEHTAKWNAVVTSFFIDTNSNVLQNVEQIARLLPPGGVWINLGPLVYSYGAHAMDGCGIKQARRTTHGAPGEAQAEEAVEGLEHKEADSHELVHLAYDELKASFATFGLRLVSEKLDVPCFYAQDQRSLKVRAYRCVFFKCVKE